MSTDPVIGYKNSMFQNSTDGFIHWKEEVDHTKLHHLLISIGKFSREAIIESKDKLGLLYTADALAQLESRDNEAAGKVRALLREQALA